MIFSAKLRLVHAWIALLAILFGALAPALSHAMTADRATVMEICTMSGVRMVTVDQAGSQPAQDLADHFMKHCAWCAAGGQPLALPPPAPFLMPLPAAATLVPVAFHHATHTLFAWAPGNPRGPPASS